MRTRLGLALFLAAAVLAGACQAYNMEGVDPQTIVAVESGGTFKGAKSPILLIVQDRSGSMNGCFGGAPAADLTEGCGRDADDDGVLDDRFQSRMDVAQNVMRDTISRHTSDVNYGLILYGVGSASCGDPETVVAVDTSTDANPAQIAEGVRREYSQNVSIEKPLGGTPTTVALRRAYDELVGADGLKDATRDNYVVLITDGLMNCNPDHPIPCTCSQEAGCVGGIAYGAEYTGSQAEFCLDDDAAVAQVQALRTAGVKTFVIGLSENFETDQIAIPVLNALAVAGDAPREDPAQPDIKFYPAGDQAALAASLDDIISSITAPCEYVLDGPVCEGRLVAVNLSIDGAAVGTSCDSRVIDPAAVGGVTNGWYFVNNDPQKITFSPDLCARLQSAGEVQVSIKGVETACDVNEAGQTIGPACDLSGL